MKYVQYHEFQLLAVHGTVTFRSKNVTESWLHENITDEILIYNQIHANPPKTILIVGNLMQRFCAKSREYVGLN